MAQEVKNTLKTIDPQNLENILAEYHHGISFKPLADEPDPAQVLPLVRDKIAYMILPDAKRDPVQEAEIVKQILGVSGSGTATGTGFTPGTETQKIFMFIPGQKFDSLGTRHGHGAGWYDHFLNRVPREWLRVGLCTPQQFSEKPLVRQPWDEEMDYVCIAH